MHANSTHIITSVDAMLELGAACSRLSHAGDLWILNGDLGAGKTHWTKGFLQGLGSTDDVTSPTFNLVHEYAGGRVPVLHFDFYRVQDAAELLAIGWDEYLDQSAIVIAEWGDRFPDLFPPHARTVNITVLADGSRRVEMAAC